MDIHKILRFLFPEYQIIESIKRHGFIAKSKAVDVVPQSVVFGQSGTQGQVMQPQPQDMPSQKQQVNTKASGNAVAYSGKTNVKVAGNQIDNSIENAKRVVQNQFVGQRAAIDDLFIAFKRPFVAGVQKDKPKNTFIMIGTESIGKNSHIEAAINALKQEKLLNYSTAPKVDLSLYPSQSEKPLFLSDLYKALYTSSDVIVQSRRLTQPCHGRPRRAA